MLDRETALATLVGMTMGVFLWHSVIDHDWPRAFDRSFWMALASAVLYFTLGGR